MEPEKGGRKKAREAAEMGARFCPLVPRRETVMLLTFC